MTCIYAKSVGAKVACHCPDIAGGQRYTFVQVSRCQTCPHSTDTDPVTNLPAKPSGCVFLGPELAKAPCSGCGGAATVPVMTCALLGECIERNRDRDRLVAPQSLEGAAKERQERLGKQRTCDRCELRTTAVHQQCETWQDRKRLFEQNAADWLSFSGSEITARDLAWHTAQHSEHCGFVVRGGVEALWIDEMAELSKPKIESVIYRRSALAAVGIWEAEPVAGADLDWHMMRTLLRAGWIGVRA